MPWTIEIKMELLTKACDILWAEIQKTEMNVNDYLQRGSEMPFDPLKNQFAFMCDLAPGQVLNDIQDILVQNGDYDITEFTLKSVRCNPVDLVMESDCPEWAYLFTLLEVQR